jgi:hypothetical protein
MAGIGHTPKPSVFDRPACPKCSGPMDLTRIEPHKPGFDRRSFECPACQHSESSVVKFE